jgi:hypothetical protein
MAERHLQEYLAEEKPMTDTERERSSGDKGLTIRRGRVDSLDIFEVTESELDTLERGSPNSIYFNFCIFFASAFVTLTITMYTVDIKSAIKISLFFSADVISLIATALLGILWWQSKNEVKEVLGVIRGRVPREEIGGTSTDDTVNVA